MFLFVWKKTRSVDGIEVLPYPVFTKELWFGALIRRGAFPEIGTPFVTTFNAEFFSPQWLL